MGKRKKGLFSKALYGIEAVGNRLPHPITLFSVFTLFIILLSAICAHLGLSATAELVDASTGAVITKTVHTVSLLDKNGIAYMLTSMIKNFTDFAPLGVVLVTMLGIGCAEGSGYLSALLKKLVGITPKHIITPMLVFLGVMSNVATDVGYVILIPLGALIFMAYGRHPIAGLAATFSGVSGGFSANLIIGALDPLLAGISTEAARIVDPTYTVLATSNWYFMIASTVLIVILGTIVTDKIIEPRLGKYSVDTQNDANIDTLSPQEAKGLKIATAVLAALIATVAIAAFDKNSILRNPDTGSLTNDSVLMNGLIVILAALFFIPSVIYGRISGTYKGERDVCIQLEKNMSMMGSYIALIFVAAQFISFFNYTGLGTILAVNGANLLRMLPLPAPLLIVIFILFCAAVNLIMGSATAKWTILAPIFVPMFMMLGFSPELCQVAYRIGDSCTNIISPMMTYFAMITVYARRYDKNAGIGTLISTMIPYSVFFLVGWSLLLVVWMLAALPLGPGA